VFFAVVLVTLAVDQFGKSWAAARLVTGSVALGPIRFELSRNTGASFGLGRSLTVWITLATFAAVAALAVLGARARSGTWALALGLMAGGALGNGVDRIARSPEALRGGVVDWIKVPFYGPVFNVADVALRTGVLLVVVLMLRSTPHRKVSHAPDGERQATLPE
jgi:signal peptidase II